MTERLSFTRRGLFRGVGSATLVAGCARPSVDAPSTNPGVIDAIAPGDLGPDTARLEFTLNGKRTETSVEPRTTLLEALRGQLGLTGAKEVCDRGVCGACTVLVDGIPRNGCMMLAHDVAGRSVVTVEGLGHDPVGARLQRAFVEHDALQCGFCTSGMLVTCTALLHRTRERDAPLDASAVNHAIAGNLCRCGTYPHVVAAVLATASGKSEHGGGPA